MTPSSEFSLGKTLLAHLRNTPRDTWSIDALSILQWLLSKTPRLDDVLEKGHAAQATLRAWMDTLPVHDGQTMASLLPKNTGLFLGVCLPTLLVWAREQDWRAAVDTHNTMLLVLELLSADPDSLQCTQTESLAASALCARSIKDIIEDVTDRNDAWVLVGPWLMSRNEFFWPNSQSKWHAVRQYHEAFFDIWAALAIASQHVDSGRFDNEKSRPLLFRWKMALIGPWAHLDANEECRLTRSLVRSCLADPLTFFLCQTANHARTLDDADTRAFMLCHLPANEEERLDALPWKKTSRFNTELARMYVPNIASLVDVLGTPELWADVQAHKALLRSLASRAGEVSLLDLPCDTFDTSAAP